MKVNAAFLLFFNVAIILDVIEAAGYLSGDAYLNSRTTNKKKNDLGFRISTDEARSRNN
jgi:hypothetical protein